MHCILGGGGGALDGEFLYTCLFQTRPHASTPLACLPACLPTHVNCTTIANKFIHNLAGYIQQQKLHHRSRAAAACIVFVYAYFIHNSIWCINGIPTRSPTGMPT